MEFRKFYAKIKFEIPAHFFRKKRRERGNLSVKMDSRFRGNDSGEGGNFTRKFEIPAHFFRKKLRERGNLSAKMDSRVRGNDGGEAAHFTRKLSLEFPHIFFAKNGNAGIFFAFAGKNLSARNNGVICRGSHAGICRRKWIPAFAGMTAGRRHILREN